MKRSVLILLLSFLIPTAAVGQITTLHNTIRRIPVQDTAGNIAHGYLLWFDTLNGMIWGAEIDSTIRGHIIQGISGNFQHGYVLKANIAGGDSTFVFAEDAGGVEVDTTIRGIPIQDTTGNIGDNYVNVWDPVAGRMNWEAQAGAGGGETNTLSSVGETAAGADSLTAGKSGLDLRVKSLIAGDSLDATATDSTLTLDVSGFSNYLPLAGGTMSGDISMGVNNVTSVAVLAGGVGTPLDISALTSQPVYIRTVGGDTVKFLSGVITKGVWQGTIIDMDYLDTAEIRDSIESIVAAGYLALAGGTMTGDIDMDSGLILEPSVIDMTEYSFIEEVDQAAFRTYIEFGQDIMYIGATNASNNRERCWDFGLAEMTALSPATIGQVKINGDVDWEGNAIAKAYIAANAIDSTKVVANSLSFSDDLRLFTIAELETQLGGTDNVLLETEIDASSELLALIDDETGSGLVVFGTSPTFTTDITSPLIIGGTGTTSDLSLKTTSGVGTTGADMHFLVGNDGATEAVTILNNGYVGIGTNAPNAPLEVKGIFQGEVGGFPSGLFHVTRGGDAEFANAVITGHNTYNTNTQLWYLGSTSSGNYNIALLNRQDGDIHFHTNDAFRMTIVSAGNVGIGTPSPPEKMSVVGNIATGDTTTGDVDVFHYFSTDGSWVTEYLKWDDGIGEFQLSDDIDITGNIVVSGDLAVTGRVSSGDTLDYTFNLADPDALFATDAEWCIDPRVSDAITITRIDVTLDADPTTELTFSLKFADAFIGFGNAVVIDDTATVAGVTTVTGGFGDATVPANKCLYLLIDADPDDAITQASFKVSYTVD